MYGELAVKIVMQLVCLSKSEKSSFVVSRKNFCFRHTSVNVSLKSLPPLKLLNVSCLLAGEKIIWGKKLHFFRIKIIFFNYFLHHHHYNCPHRKSLALFLLLFYFVVRIQCYKRKLVLNYLILDLVHYNGILS